MQIQRTHLSWEPTAIGFLAIGAIVLFNSGGPLGAGRTVLALLAIASGLVTFGISRICGRTLLGTDRPGRSVISPPPVVPVWLIGGSTVFLAAALLLDLALSR